MFDKLNETLERALEGLEIVESENPAEETFYGKVEPAGDNDEHYLIKMDGVAGEFDVWVGEDETLEQAIQEQDWIDEFQDQLEYCTQSVEIHVKDNNVEVNVFYDMDDDVCATFGADDDKPNYL